MVDEVKLFKIAYECLRKLKEDEITKLIQGELELTVTSRNTKRIASKARTESVPQEAAFQEVIEALKDYASREEALTYLAKRKFRKAELREIANKLEIGVVSKDTIAVMQTKIVEHTVGTKLRFDTLLTSKL